MSVQRILSLITGTIGMIAFFGSLSLPLFVTNDISFNFGSGFMPLLCSILLIGFSVWLFFSDKDQPKLARRWLTDPSKFRALNYYLLCWGMLILIYFVGMITAMTIFGISTQLILRRQTPFWTVLFNVIWVGALYCLFVVFLKIPFEKGLLFR